MNEIKKEHILAAIDEIESKGIRAGRHSSTYDLIYKDKHYPPKLVISIANRYATGEELDSNIFHGGPNKPAFQLLGREGFTIVEKNESTNFKIINKYIQKLKSGEINAAQSIKSLIETNNFESNLAILDKIFFNNKLQDINSINYNDTIGFIKEIHKIKSGEYNDFNVWSASKTLLRSIDEDLINQHDELNKKVGFPDNGNGLYKSFLGDKNLLAFVIDTFDNNLSRSKQYWLYAPGENASKWDKFYDEGIFGLGWDDIGDLKQYKNRSEIKEALVKAFGGEGSKKNDVSANDDFLNKVNIGDVVIVKKGRGELLGYGIVTSDYYFDEKKIDYKSCRKIEWKLKGSWKLDFSLVLKTLTDITKYSSEHPGYNKYYELLLGIMENNIKTEIIKEMNFSLNTILYGPPGTGKTYRLQNEFFDKFTVKESSLSREQYLESIVADLSWWQVISIAVLDLGESKVNEIHNHEFVKFKEKLSSSKTVRPTIWGQLQSHTVRDCPNVNVVSRSEPLFFNKSADSKWTIDEVLLEEYYPEAIELLAISKSYKPSDDVTIKNYDFVTFHQSFSYEDFVEGIKPRLEDGETEVSFEIKDGIFKKLCIKAEADPENNYAVFIDEINRGNVSAIFGELITLIEDDKRIGAANELRIKLPYSKRELGVPSNLYIIGTMNTADRSVEAIDTALRRRFSFSEIMPNPKLLKEKHFKGFNLGEVLSTINERIEVLLDRDHTIGHSYFLKTNNGDKEALKSVFKNNIFPLLQEYFYHDYEKIALILGEGFVRIKENKTTKFAAFRNIDQPEIMTQFELIDEVEDIEEAVKLLLNN